MRIDQTEIEQSITMFSCLCASVRMEVGKHRGKFTKLCRVVRDSRYDRRGGQFSSEK